MIGVRCLVSATFLALSFQVLAAADKNSCVDCHQKTDFFAEYPKLHEYYHQWLGSPHEQAGLTCEDCHGGRPNEASMKRAHKGVLPMSAKRSSLHATRQPDTCGECHRANKRQFVKSKHYQALMGERSAPTCTTCHPAMGRRPELRTIVLNACRNCHAEGNAEGLPLIADHAEKAFNQLNIAGGLLGWTQMHFESHGWPKDSREQVAELERRYAEIVDQVHQFDLAQTETSAIELLGELRVIFREARREHEQRNEAS